MNIIKLEDINEELARGVYGDLEVIFLKENGYINISKLCKYGLTKEGNPKEFSNWYKTDLAKEIISCLDNTIFGSNPRRLESKNESTCLIHKTNFPIACLDQRSYRI